MQGSGRAVTWAADNFDTNVVCLLDVMRAFSAVRPVGIGLFKRGDLGTRLRNNGCSGVPVLYARRRYRERDEQSHRIDDRVAFPPLTFLAASNPLLPPCGEARFDCASMTAAAGALKRHMRARHCSRSRSFICSNTPALIQRANAL